MCRNRVSYDTLFFNAALGGASDFMATRRNNDNGKLNKVVAVSASVIAVLILALTVYGAHF